MNNMMMTTMIPNAPSAISYADPAAVAAAEAVKARIQSAYQVAICRPRSYDQSRIKILEACSRPSFAEKVEYSKPVGGGKPIVGPSIRFAELALREWGNITYENQVLYDDESTRRISVVITDLETNTTFSSAIQIDKTVERKNAKGREVVSERLNSYGEKIYIVKATDDEIMNKQSAAVSKTLRNEGLRLIPQDIIEEAIERARETIKKRDKTDPDAARKKLADIFAVLRIMPADLEKFLGHPLGQTTPSELQELRSIYQTIKDGEAKWSDYVEQFQEESGPIAQESKRKANELKEKLKEKRSSKDQAEPRSFRDEMNDTPDLPISDTNGAV
nr:hypothetical protein [uncultured Dethiosulfovibrio sp.]